MQFDFRRLAAHTFLTAGIVVAGCATAVAQVRTEGATTVYTAPPPQPLTDADIANAKPMPMPAARGNPPSPLHPAGDPHLLFGSPGVSPGDPGTGEENPVQLLPPRVLEDKTPVNPPEFGTSNQVFTTNQVNASGNRTSKFYPYRAAGKLFFKIGANNFLCSASLIKPGIVVTAAHCVANFGKNQFYTAWQFVPAYNNGSAPYGTWTVKQARVITAYLNGSDSCAQTGVICKDDVAVLALNPQSGKFAGTTAGWFGFGWNGYSFNGSSQALISQLGYPVALDGGVLMERDDSQGFVSGSLSNNTIIGSLMTGGSSGGPWLVNLGMQPTLSGVSFGNMPNRNIVVGVTSWGYTDLTVKQQGASSFTTGNIVALVNAQCAATPKNC